MKKIAFVLFLVLMFCKAYAQESVEVSQQNKRLSQIIAQDTLKSSNFTKKVNPVKKDSLRPPFKDYLIISHERDTTHVDTSLSIHMDYKFNYLRKDNFGLIPFSNLGQSYNSLTYDFKNSSTMPNFGARARHFNYLEIEDIHYYNVPTPLTELFFKTAFEQGQLVDTFFTVNTSPQLNFSIAYKGLRSLGKYQNILTSTGNFRFTTNYTTKNKRYHARGHMVTQDLLNNENGGLTDASVVNFESEDSDFRDRSLLDVRLSDARSTIIGKRFHLDHIYTVSNQKDSLSKSKLDFRHIMSFEDKYYNYKQGSSLDALFGVAFRGRNVFDKVTLENFYNKLQLEYNHELLGKLMLNMNNTNYNYGYNKLVEIADNRITNRLKGDILALGANYSKQYKGFKLDGELGANVSGDFDGNYFKATAVFNLKEGIEAAASINHSSKLPNYNTLLYQSTYLNYNWQNSFSNIETQQLAFTLKYKRLLKATVDYSTISDYVYFTEDKSSNQVKPVQNDKLITYLRIKLENEIGIGKFGLTNTVMYQNVQDENDVLNVPQVNTRNTLHFSSHMFKKALFLQTGITLNYFTKYYMNAYNPLLAEFYVQTEREYGDFPRLDYFINAKIRQARLYLKAEHFNAGFTGNKFYSAPNHPYRDFTVRFGVVWNLFK